MSDPRVIGLAGVGLQVPELRVAEKFYGTFGLDAHKRGAAFDGERADGLLHGERQADEFQRHVHSPALRQILDGGDHLRVADGPVGGQLFQFAAGPGRQKEHSSRVDDCSGLGRVVSVKAPVGDDKPCDGRR